LIKEVKKTRNKRASKTKIPAGATYGSTKIQTVSQNLNERPFLELLEYYWLFVREHGVHAGPKDYFVVVVVVVICGSI
jgi:hypothetical protein